MVAERYHYRFFFWRGGQLLFAERLNHRFGFFEKTVATRGTLHCSHCLLNLQLCLAHLYGTNGRNLFTFNASSSA